MALGVIVGEEIDDAEIAEGVDVFGVEGDDGFEFGDGEGGLIVLEVGGGFAQVILDFLLMAEVAAECADADWAAVRGAQVSDAAAASRKRQTAARDAKCIGGIFKLYDWGTRNPKSYRAKKNRRAALLRRPPVWLVCVRT